MLSFCFGEPEGLPAVDEVCIFDGEGGATAFSTVAGVGAGGADIVTIRFFSEKGILFSVLFLTQGTCAFVACLRCRSHADS